MKKLIKLTPIILAILYYLFVRQSDFSWNLKMTILCSMIIVSIYSLIKSNDLLNKIRLRYLVFGLISAIVVGLFFFIMI